MHTYIYIYIYTYTYTFTYTYTYIYTYTYTYTSRHIHIHILSVSLSPKLKLCLIPGAHSTSTRLSQNRLAWTKAETWLRRDRCGWLTRSLVTAWTAQHCQFESHKGRLHQAWLSWTNCRCRSTALGACGLMKIAELQWAAAVSCSGRPLWPRRAANARIAAGRWRHWDQGWAPLQSMSAAVDTRHCTPQWPVRMRPRRGGVTHDSEPLRPGLNTTTYYLLLTTYYLLLTTYYLLLTTYYLLPTTYYLLPNTY